tara:strand:- start:114 stop:290 length:177 start_codon:yes stop_codon:yes gene_type:complete
MLIKKRSVERFFYKKLKKGLRLILHFVECAPLQRATAKTTVTLAEGSQKFLRKFKEND